MPAAHPPIDAMQDQPHTTPVVLDEIFFADSSPANFLKVSYTKYAKPEASAVWKSQVFEQNIYLSELHDFSTNDLMIVMAECSQAAEDLSLRDCKATNYKWRIAGITEKLCKTILKNRELAKAD